MVLVHRFIDPHSRTEGFQTEATFSRRFGMQRGEMEAFRARFLLEQRAAYRWKVFIERGNCADGRAQQTSCVTAWRALPPAEQSIDWGRTKLRDKLIAAAARMMDLSPPPAIHEGGPPDVMLRRIASSARDAQAWAARQTGETLASIGKRFGVGPERIRQRVAKHDRLIERGHDPAGLFWRRAHAAMIPENDDPEALGEWQSWTPEAQHLEIAASRRDVLVLA